MLLHARDSNDLLVALLAASSGELQVDVPDLAAALASIATDKLRVSVVDALPAGSANIGDVDVLTLPVAVVKPQATERLWGFKAIVEEQLLDVTLSAGTNTLTGTAVPANTIHVITQIMLYYAGTTPTRIYAQATGLASNIVVYSVESPASGAFNTATVNAILQAGDHLDAIVIGATLNDDLVMRYSGYSFASGYPS